ncbi:hypothetical protein MCOR27_011348 [Pyricularia oryzae]|uniref:Uncharacterized protein n=2 Tax=Pyricularia TaxID=48558 RepID=A0A4P7NSP0_PYROR|nr:hypothetical protein MCOR01_010172 [Pyricularia oryzae]KAI6265583.1 hypothetical protein MCOR27_011348 [Pyricularia oryzae]KAI6266256.1 hypothetical protein MCOR26_010280 [Pyricularia oryzae]KAI6307248.1 hypothetical protein MCOR29_009753 [Pyricularia oryzae]KAI6309520.1 hypothetical protein MCOR30_011308 [Pyricularia oryzae]
MDPQKQSEHDSIRDSIVAGASRPGPPPSESSSTTAEPAHGPKPAKRRRIAIACTTCRIRKSKCDAGRPRCSTCRDYGTDCAYSPSGPLNGATASREHYESVETRLLALERALTGLASRVDGIERQRARTPPSPQPVTVAADDEDPGETVASQDPTDGIGTIVFTRDENFGFFGPSSNIAFIRSIVAAITATVGRRQTGQSPDETRSVEASNNRVLHVSRPPSPARHGPSSRRSRAREGSAYDLPPPGETLDLIQSYFATTGLLFPYIHEESFLDTYHEVAASRFRKVRRSWLGLLNMVLAMATSVTLGNTLDAPSRRLKSDVFFSRALALCETQIRCAASVDIVQFLLLMSQYLQGTDRSTQTWSVHGLAVKAAYHLGLHSQMELRRYTPIELEIRARTWYGCVILDRTLSMTLGRPCSIPESHVKLNLPRPWPSSGSVNGGAQAEASLKFFNATISLYKIMWNVIDLLYEGNLGCEAPKNIFDIASHLLRIEHQLLEWQHCLPPTLPLVQPGELTGTPTAAVPSPLCRLRVILTLRYLNLRVLAHRPVLQIYLAELGAATTGGGGPPAQQRRRATLHQVGANSMRLCVQSAASIVEIVSHVVRSDGLTKQMLGAWWFSLYYTFNAALVIYSAILVQNDPMVNTAVDSLDFRGMDIRRDLLSQAAESLLLLDRGNRMTEKCAKYTYALMHILDSQYPIEGPVNSSSANLLSQLLQRSNPTADGAANIAFNFSPYGEPPLEFDMHMNEFMDIADLGMFASPSSPGGVYSGQNI